MACSIKLTLNQRIALEDELRWSEFRKQLKGYYQGRANVPDISLLHDFILNEVIPEYFPDRFGPQDLLDFLNDVTNGGALRAAIAQMINDTVAYNTTGLPDVDYTSPRYDIYNDLFNAALTKVDSRDKDQAEAETVLETVDSTAEGMLPDQEAIFKRMYANREAYIQDRFKASSLTENLFRGKFINDFFLKAVYVDTDKRKIVSQTQQPGQLSEIDTNLKAKRMDLLADLITRLNIKESVNGRAVPITMNESLLVPQRFEEVLTLIEQAVMRPVYNKDVYNLEEDGVLFELSNKYRNSADSKTSDALGEIVNNYIDYVIVADYDKILEYYFPNSISVSQRVDPFDKSIRKYNLSSSLSLDAMNVNWEEKVQNGVEATAELYKMVIDSTPTLNFITGLPMKEFLYPTLVSEVFSKYFSEIDFQNLIPSIKSLVMEGLENDNNSFTTKNVLYTMYKKFFEEDGDNITLNRNNVEFNTKDRQVKSLLATVKQDGDNINHPLMLLIAKPLEEISKVFYAEALETRSGRPSIVYASTNSNTVTKSLIVKKITNALNRDEETLTDIIRSFNIKNGANTGIDGDFSFTYEGEVYNITAKASKYSVDAMIALTEAVLQMNLTSDRPSPDKEFYEELKAITKQSEQLPHTFIQFVRTAVKTMLAKHSLYDTKVQKILTEDRGAKDTKNKIIDTLMRDKDASLNYRNPGETVLTLSTPAAHEMYDLITSSNNRYSGNRVKSTVTTLEGTAVAGFSLYNYFLGYKNNLAKIRQQNRSIVSAPGNRNVLTSNPFFNDPNLLNSFFIRGAIKIKDKVKPNSNHSVLETLTYNINLGYFGVIDKALTENKPVAPLFDPTTYSDKTTNFLPAINNTYNSPGRAGITLFTDSSGKAVNEDVTLKLAYESNAGYYRAYANNIIDTWGGIYSAMAAEGNPNAPDMTGIVESKNLSDKLITLNTINSDIWNKSGHPYGLKGYAAARYYADKAGVHLTAQIHYQNKKSLTMKPALIDYVKLFDQGNNSTAYKARLDKIMIQSANDLVEAGFKFQGDAVRAITKMYPKLNAQFSEKDNSAVYLKNKHSVGKITKTTDINPAYRKYFYDWNFASESLLNSSLGSIYSHKGGTENAMWLTMTKRNVAAGASMRRYTLGLENGVEDFTRTAFVDDIETLLKTIHGSIDQVVDLDGAAYATYTQRIKTWNSLNSHFSGDGGLDHKPFTTHFDPKTGEVGINKFADFAMTNELIRASIGSDIDLLELHKELYGTDISKVDITRSWRDDVNLSDFTDVYRWDRKYDYTNMTTGTIFKLNGLTFAGPGLNGVNQYKVKETNMNTGEVTEKLIPIATMFDLWQVLGGIDSVDITDDKTATYYEEIGTGRKVHVKESHGSAYKLLDFENYMGEKGTYILPENYIPLRNDKDGKLYAKYKAIFGTDGVVNTHLQLINDALAGNIPTQEVLNSYNIPTDPISLSIFIKENRTALKDFMKYIIKDESNPEDMFKWNTRKYQPFKGKNIDRITTAGAQKVGQFNINDTSTYSRSRREKALKDLKLDDLGQRHADEVIGKLGQDAYLGDRELTPEESAWSAAVGKKYSDVSKGIPGITKLITHQINNMNSGVQLSAYHETEGSSVTLPTQMFNAFAFKANSLLDVNEIYNAIADIVEEGLTDTFFEGSPSGKETLNIPELVRQLSDGTGNVATAKNTLLRIFKEIMMRKVQNDEDFTLEQLIVDTFSHDELPIDDSHMFSSAIAELTNYFTKRGIKIEFDGMFAVLSPGSGMYQFRDVVGGYLPVKSGVQLKLKPITTLTPLSSEDYKNWKEYNTYAKIKGTKESEPRDLKGQQVVLTDDKGGVISLSILRDGEKHLIPEAEALSDIKQYVDKWKDSVNNDEYKIATFDEKQALLDKYLLDFKADTSKFINSNPRALEFFSRFVSRMEETVGMDGVTDYFDFFYETLMNGQAARQAKMKQLAADGNKRELTLAMEYELFDRINVIGKVFTYELQGFMQEAATGIIPESLKGKHYKGPKITDTHKLTVSRGEVIAPVVMRKAFLLREGDNFSDITKELFIERLLEQSNRENNGADAVLESTKGRTVYFHKGEAPVDLKESNKVKIKDGRKWFTVGTDTELFTIPRDVFISDIQGDVHVFLGNKYTLEENPIAKNLSKIFKGEGEKFKEIAYFKQTEEGKAEAEAKRQAQAVSKAEEMWNSWNEYVNIIGTRIPGQHFQSFQGLKIIGFVESNKIYVPNEVTLLSGSDFDIDKQNIIYYSINKGGLIESWHPSFSWSTPQLMKMSLQLPLPGKRTAAEFSTEVDVTGRSLSPEMEVNPELDLKELENLIFVYDQLKSGLKLHPVNHKAIIDQLVILDSGSQLIDSDGVNVAGMRKAVTLNGIKNFAISRANNIIESPLNFLLLYKPVSMATPKMFGDNSPKGAASKLRVRENPVSIAEAKYDNMVGKKVIGIMAAGGLKALSALTVTYNNSLRQMSDNLYKLRQLETSLSTLDLLTESHLTNPLKEAIGKVKGDISYIKTGLLSKVSVANIRFDGLDPEVASHINLYPGAPALKERLSNKFNIKDGIIPMEYKMKLLESLSIKGEFDPDAAELLSELLSAATDNAKELILAKINATPELAGIYANLIISNTPFEEIVDVMTSPIVDLVVNNAGRDIFDNNTGANSLKNLISLIETISSKPAYRAANINRLQTNYNMKWVGGDEALVSDTKVGSDPNMTYSLADFRKLQMMFETADDLRLLSKYLGINQGIRSNSWELYNFKVTIQDYVNKKLEGGNFDFKRFLDSLESGDTYHKDMVIRLSERLPENANFNVLYVLASTPNFAKQLVAYNSANTLLNLSSYKINTVYNIVDKLRAINFLSPTQNINENQYREIERFIDNTVVDNFMQSESDMRYENPEEAKKMQPLFYNGDKPLRLTTDEQRLEFANWVTEKFLPRIQEQYKNNEFIQELLVDDKADVLLNAKFKFMHLTMDTTNVKSDQQRAYRDSYLYNLGLLYHNNDTDLQYGIAGPEDSSKQNNIFNVLFWYNLLINKNNITKNSYAKLLGELMLRSPGSNPYKRFLELKGRLGKAEDVNLSGENNLLTSNGVQFDLWDMFKNYEIVSADIDRSSAEEVDFDTQSMIDDDLANSFDGGGDDHHDNDGGSDADGSFEGDDYSLDDEIDSGEVDDEGKPIKKKKLIVTRTRRIGSPGTITKISVGKPNEGQVLFDSTGSPNIPYMVIPHSSRSRSKHMSVSSKLSADIGLSVNETDAVNYQRFMLMSIHQLLSSLDGVEIQIMREGEAPVIFDPNETYGCL